MREQFSRYAGDSALPESDDRAEGKRRAILIALTALVAVLAVAVVAAFGFIFMRASANRAAAEEAALVEKCEVQGLRITADPMISAAIEDVIAELAESAPDCAEVVVQTEESAVTASALAAGTTPDFDVWIPDSAIWPQRVADETQLTGAQSAALVVGPTVASTPVVFATTDSDSAALIDADGGLASFVGGTVAPVLPDPASSASSSAALQALQGAADEDMRTFTALVLTLEEGVVPTTSDALAAVANATTPTVALTTEQAVRASGSTDLVSVYPSEGVGSLGIPIVSLAGSTAETSDSIAALTDAIAVRSGVLAAHGLRDAAGTPYDATQGTAIAVPNAEQIASQTEVLASWRVLTAPSRMLALVDVSGSMLQTAPNQMRRIELFEQAAVRAVNSLSETSDLGIWIFSSLRDGDRDWEELVPFGSLGDPEHKQRVLEAANTLDSHVVGGTGLYDSLLAAVQYMRETYQPGYANVVLLNTDGINEDDQGMDLPQLLEELEKMSNPAEPVAVIAVGYGPETDQAVLEQIAAATGGAAYQALQPEDITTVLVDAVTQRSCRPTCS